MKNETHDDASRVDFCERCRRNEDVSEAQSETKRKSELTRMTREVVHLSIGANGVQQNVRLGKGLKELTLICSKFVVSLKAG